MLPALVGGRAGGRVVLQWLWLFGQYNPRTRRLGLFQAQRMPITVMDVESGVEWMFNERRSSASRVLDVLVEGDA